MLQTSFDNLLGKKVFKNHSLNPSGLSIRASFFICCVNNTFF